ncbi:unnamed protein product [Cyprideis torosa]|uniref:RING-type domain-containing protein n=1 Tax=Cyprideis torosa TaxID=163714 RepID=A0A7R8WD13_9CRUS|nr:unnamed protein product [Cyprideis torosa]CAG0894145.1 unnamed protein product [Cyprideis torosa]
MLRLVYGIYSLLCVSWDALVALTGLLADVNFELVSIVLNGLSVVLESSLNFLCSALDGAVTLVKDMEVFLSDLWSLASALSSSLFSLPMVLSEVKILAARVVETTKTTANAATANALFALKSLGAGFVWLFEGIGEIYAMVWEALVFGCDLVPYLLKSAGSVCAQFVLDTFDSFRSSALVLGQYLSEFLLSLLDAIPHLLNLPFSLIGCLPKRALLGLALTVALISFALLCSSFFRTSVRLMTRWTLRFCNGLLDASRRILLDWTRFLFHILYEILLFLIYRTAFDEYVNRGSHRNFGSISESEIILRESTPVPDLPRPSPNGSPETVRVKHCVVCQDQPCSIVILPCRHCCICRDCGIELTKHTHYCPLCRGRIRDFLSVYIPTWPDYLRGRLEMAASRDSETHIWLLNKLGTSNDTWVGGSIWSHFTVDVLRNIEECFATKNLPAQVKLKVLLSIFQMPRRNLDEWRDELECILKIAMEDTDPWVSMIAEFMKPYPSSGALNMEIAAPGENKEMFDSLLEEIRDVVSSTADSTDLTPLDAVFLNHTSLNAAYGPAKSPQKHFSLKKKTKASQLKTELIAKSTEAASQTKRSSVTTVPVRTRGMPRKMTDKSESVGGRIGSEWEKRWTPLKSLPSYHRPAASSAAHRPIGRPPLQKEGGIKLLDITEQPMGHGLAKKKRKAGEWTEEKEGESSARVKLEEQPPVPGGSTSPLAKKPPLPAGPGAEFPPPPSVGPPSVMPFQDAPKQGGPPSLAPPQTPDYTGLLSPLAHPPATPLNSYLPPTPLSVYSNPIPTPGSVDLFPPPPTPQGIPPSDSALPHPPTSEFVAPAPSETPPQPPPPVMYGAPPPTPHVQPLPQAEDRKPPPPYSAHLLPPTPAAGRGQRSFKLTLTTLLLLHFSCCFH